MSTPSYATQVPANPAIQNPTATSYQASLPSASTLEGMASQLLNSIIQGLLGALQGFITPGADPLTQLSSWADDLEAVPQDILNALISFFSGGAITTGSPETLLTAIETWAEQIPLIGPLIEELGGAGNSLASLANTLQTYVTNFNITLVPVGALTTAQPNLLPTTIFSTDTIAPNPDWSADSTTERTTGNGSVTITADGRLHGLRSGTGPTDTISVGTGQTITALIYAINQGYTGFGDPPIQLQLVPFTAQGAQPPVTLDTYTPTGDITDWGSAHELTGSYTVPDGVIGVQFRLFVNDTALTGTFHFADGSVTQTGLISQSSVSGLPGALTGLNSLWQSGMDAIASAASGIPVVGTEISDVVTAIENFNPGNVIGTLGSELLSGDLTGIVGTIIDAVEGNSQGTTTSASLAQLYNSVNAKINNTANADVTQFADTTTTIPIESWSNQIDLVGGGDGQAGEQGLIFNFFGQGGQPGKINAASLLRGTHYDAGTPYVTVTINTDGSVTLGVPAGTATAAHSINCAAGSGSESPHFGTGYPGIGNGSFTYNGKVYAFGGNQNTAGAAGLGPSGGGAGGNGTLFQAGGPGAPGGGFVRQLATVISGGSTGADVTPPSGGVGTVVSATNTSITVSVTGAVDA